MARYNTVSSTSSVTGGSTITTPSSGLLTTLTGSGTVTVPNPVLYTGQTQTFYNSTASTIPLTTPSGNFIAPGFTSSGTINLPAGSILTIVSDGTNYEATSWLGGTISTSNLVATGGTIDNVIIGATTNVSGKFSTLTATSTTTLAGMTATTGAFSGISTFTNSAAVTLGTTSTGALQVTAGGASIAGGLYVAGASQFGANLTISVPANTGAFSISGNTSSNVLGDINITRSGSAQSGVGQGANIQFNNSSSGSAAIIQEYQGGLIFFTDYNAGGWVQRIFVNSVNGNIGIGTGNSSSSLYKLDVGPLTGSGQTTTSGSTGGIRNSAPADSSPYTQARITVYGDTGVDTANWGYLAYGADANMRIIYGKTGSGSNPSLILGTSSAMNGTGTVTNTASLDTNGNFSAAGNFINNAGGFQIIQSGVTVSVTGKTKVTYSCTGAQQTFTVPAGVYYIYVKCWGAGGGGGNSGGWSYGSDGGGGGHTRGLIPVTPGEVLQIVVGQGGQTNGNYYQTNNYGGGGGFQVNSDNRYAGIGGGYCGIFRSSVSQANALLIAGGGGGGGASRMWSGNWGGAGGGTTGQAGNSPYESRYTSAGGPGTQSGGGAAGATQNAQGGGAGALVGGYGASNCYGGGGGGGYFGGGGGGYYESHTMAGGGGGSGYIGSTVIYGATFTGHRNTPAMHQDSDLPKTYDGYNNWAKFATGGDSVASSSQYTSAGGGSGYMVIYY